MCMSLYLSVASCVSRFICMYVHTSACMSFRVYISRCIRPFPAYVPYHTYTLSVRIPCMSPPCVCPLCAHSVRMSSHVYVVHVYVPPFVCPPHVYILSVRIPCMSPLCAFRAHVLSYLCPSVCMNLRADVLSVYISSPCLRPPRVHSVQISPLIYIVSYVCRFVSRSLCK